MTLKNSQPNDGDAPAGDVAIELTDFTFQYRVQSEATLHGINLKIYAGEKVAIIGQSGSGKSTLASVINGLAKDRFPGKHTGSVRVCGLNPFELKLHETSKTVGTVLQDTDGQFIGLTVAEDIAFSLENDCVPLEQMRQKVFEAAQKVELEAHLEASPADLSGGQKQRVSIAGVLVDDVKIFVFDEPLASLDPASGARAIEVIDQLAVKTGATVIIIEHRLEDVLHRGLDRLIVMDGGRIIADGTPDEVIASPALITHGIREPLYVSATRIAAQELVERRPVSLDSAAGTGSTEEETRMADNLWVGATGQLTSLENFQILPPVVTQLRSWTEERPEQHPEKEPAVLLELKNLKFGINGKEIIRGVNATISRGQIVAICGANGAGKSTLAKLICGYERPDAGRILLNGQDITEDPIARRAKRIGYVLQNPNQMITKPIVIEEVSQSLLAGGGLEDTTAPKEQQRHEIIVEQALRTAGIWAYRNWPISALSYGQRKRVTIASVLVNKPEVIILDEPTAGQDWAHYTEIMEFLRELNQAGTTVLLVTHDMHLALEYTDQTIIVAEGKILAQQASPKVLASAELSAAASLRQTSLVRLAQKLDISDVSAFIDAFIVKEKRWRNQILAKRLGTGR